MRRSGINSTVVNNSVDCKIIRIGNSRGLLIPSPFLKKLSLKEKDDVQLYLEDDRLVIKKLEPYTGPYTGIFADMPRPEPGEPDPWGDKTTDEIMEELRGGRSWREIPEW
ncbi:MAG: AbrB/MazE/SpoVT family DNA-binding domain-containing protein [Bacteroidales bacterium]|nr:AbrB/MazE/SpoVT family DNA-binding domain-containing protein [Bacteroidales bacterium]